MKPSFLEPSLEDSLSFICSPTHHWLHLHHSNNLTVLDSVFFWWGEALEGVGFLLHFCLITTWESLKAKKNLFIFVSLVFSTLTDM